MRRALSLLAVLGPLLGACAGARPRPPATPPRVGAVVVLPVDNESGRSVPVRALLGAVEQALADEGVEIVSGAPVERWLAAHRLRFTGAVPPAAAATAAGELGAGALLVTTVEEYVAGGIPRVAFGMRLVSAEAPPRILWSGAVALAGEDSPGLFATGVVRSVAALQRTALAKLARSLRGWLATGAAPASPREEKRFAPQIRYRSDVLDGPVRTVAVLPFLNETSRRRGGDVITDAFVRALAATGRFEVAEPGVVREALFGRRVVMEGGVSLDTVRVVLDAIDADLVLAGYVREVAEDLGGAIPPRVDFTALLIDRRSEEILWEVSSSHRGDEGVWAFELGRVRSTSDLAARMIASAVRLAVDGASIRSGLATGTRLPPRSFAGVPPERTVEEPR